MEGMAEVCLPLEGALVKAAGLSGAVAKRSRVLEISLEQTTGHCYVAWSPPSLRALPVYVAILEDVEIRLK